MLKTENHISHQSIFFIFEVHDFVPLDTKHDQEKYSFLWNFLNSEQCRVRKNIKKMLPHLTWQSFCGSISVILAETSLKA